MEIEFINEFQISKPLSKEINTLLKECFHGIEYGKRDYFKQLPHYRLLAKKDQRLIGQIAIDFRVMNLNGAPINVLGIIDLCVHPSFQGKGIATKMIKKFESFASLYSEKVDFILLITDAPTFYKNLGYKSTQIITKWLKIDQHISYSIGNQNIEDASFMIKPISDKKWVDGALDFLGYMY